MRRAKIVCTIGPATESKEQLRALVDAGMDVARINRSHGSAEEHAAVYHGVREAAAESGRSVAVLVDLQGPKIRLGRFAGDEKHWLEEVTPSRSRPRTSSAPGARLHDAQGPAGRRPRR